MQDFIKDAEKFVIRYKHFVNEKHVLGVKRWGVFAVIGGKEFMVSQWFRYKHQVDRAKDRVEKQARMKDRPCITCGRTFTSEGPHNRMCNECRLEKSSMDDYRIAR